MEDIERDRCEWNLIEADPCDKDVWRSCVEIMCEICHVMCAASQLPGGEPTDEDDAPAPAC